MKMKIGELAKRSECTVETIRYYEQAGLLPVPMRSAGNFRLYGEPHVERLLFIRHCRSLGVTLGDVLRLLRLRDHPAEDCGEVNAFIDGHVAQVEIRIDELRQLKHHLFALREKCAGAGTIESCGILQGLADGSCH